MTVFRDITFLAAGPASERERSALGVKPVMVARVIDRIAWTGRVSAPPPGFDQPGLLLVLDPNAVAYDPDPRSNGPIGITSGRVWSWGNNGWSVSPVVTAIQNESAVVFDPIRNLLVSIGGYGSGNQYGDAAAREWNGVGWSYAEYLPCRL